MNQPNSNGQTLFHQICKNPETTTEKVIELLHDGADGSKLDIYGKSPLDYLPKEKSLEIMKYLFQTHKINHIIIGHNNE